MPRPIARRHPLPKQVPPAPSVAVEAEDVGEPPKPKRKRKKAE